MKVPKATMATIVASVLSQWEKHSQADWVKCSKCLSKYSKGYCIVKDTGDYVCKGCIEAPL